ncbi:hypothetical protein HPB48_002683 [Haemaphysalis longicornis]|uniref:Uncharacterized protein n=1 Tax=Haemaphysalis longicornis TaxID=44386 RepID=A0A9J6GPU0_HAELO|nr:hypothetical protein HPB48_002683 [Haemaphysalis longicornis]
MVGRAEWRLRRGAARVSRAPSRVAADLALSRRDMDWMRSRRWNSVSDDPLQPTVWARIEAKYTKFTRLCSERHPGRGNYKRRLTSIEGPGAFVSWFPHSVEKTITKG